VINRNLPPLKKKRLSLFITEPYASLQQYYTNRGKQRYTESKKMTNRFVFKGAGFSLSQSLTQAYNSEKYSIIVNNKMNNE
jgi:hypothetical protein